jgi:hypothetical protein
VLVRGYERNDGNSVDAILLDRSRKLDPAREVSKTTVGRSRAGAKGKLRAGVSDYQIDNSKLTTHCAPPCKTCRRCGRLALDLISETRSLAPNGASTASLPFAAAAPGQLAGRDQDSAHACACAEACQAELLWAPWHSSPTTLGVLFYPK